MRFRDRQRIGAAVYLPGPGEDDLDRGVVAAAGLEDRELASTVDLEIGVGILHAVDVTHLAGQVEDHVLVANQVVHGALLPDVGDIHTHPILDVSDVEQVPAVLGNQRIDEQDPCAQ